MSKLCECGCGKEVLIESSRYISGHWNKDQKVKEKKIQTWLKKYGVENPNQTKEATEKSKRTCLKKYGVENPLQLKETQEKQKETVLKKYGVEFVFQSSKVQNKYKETCLKKYGVNNPNQLEQTKETIRQSHLKKYGIDHPSKTPNGKLIRRENAIKHIEKQKLNNEPLIPCIGYQERLCLNEFQRYTPYKIIRNDPSFRYIIGRFPDGHIPELKLFIQFDERYHFLDRECKIYKQNDIDCTLQLASIGHLVFRVSEYNWLNNKDQVIKEFQSLLNLKEYVSC